MIIQDYLAQPGPASSNRHTGLSREPEPAPRAVPRWRYLLYGLFFKIRGLLVVILLPVMVLVHRGEVGSRVLGWLIGLGLFGAAWALRIRSQQYLRYRLADHAALTCSGPYTRVRNPVYIANIAGLAGLCIMCRLYWMAPLAALWAWFIYHLVVQFEEMRLEKRFGEPYRAYCQRVPRWIPTRAPAPGGNPGAGRTGFWRAARVEWQNLLLLLVPLLKQWGPWSRAGGDSSLWEGLPQLVYPHRWLIGLTVALGIGGLAAWNVTGLRRWRMKSALPASDRHGVTMP